MTSPTAPDGALLLHLPPASRVGPARAPAADLYVRLVAGALVHEGDRGVTAYRPGDLLTCARGSTWTLESGSEGAACLAWSDPAGLEQVLAAVAAEPHLDRATLVAVATDCGVQLQPEPLARSGDGPVRGRG